MRCDKEYTHMNVEQHRSGKQNIRSFWYTREFVFQIAPSITDTSCGRRVDSHTRGSHPAMNFSCWSERKTVIWAKIYAIVNYKQRWIKSVAYWIVQNHPKIFKKDQLREYRIIYIYYLRKIKLEWQWKLPFGVYCLFELENIFLRFVDH